jgi:hypothetical protein
MAAGLRFAGENAEAGLAARMPPGLLGAPVARSCYHLGCGEIDEPAEWASRAIDERHMIFLSNTIRRCQVFFRKSDKWPALLRKMNVAN